VVEQPEEHDVMAMAVNGGDGPSVIAERCCDSVIEEAVAELFRGNGQGACNKHRQYDRKRSGSEVHCLTSCVPKNSNSE
jgi:hypothetical protein